MLRKVRDDGEWVTVLFSLDFRLRGNDSCYPIPDTNQSTEARPPGEKFARSAGSYGKSAIRRQLRRTQNRTVPGKQGIG
ncbi:MAG: hypothetical protein R3179_01525, partial [Sedimenticolaceae bacterium]|nr:hypothetical protein [Sedimenticolaceae bacterium]